MSVLVGERAEQRLNLTALIQEEVSALDEFDANAVVDALMARLSDEEMRTLVRRLLVEEVGRKTREFARNALDGRAPRSLRWQSAKADQEEMTLLRVWITIAPGVRKQLGDCHRPELEMARDLLKDHARATLRRAQQLDKLVKALTDDRTPISVLGEQKVRQVLAA